LIAAQKFILKNYGERYWAGYFKRYKTKSKRAQEAHEAIRPAHPEKKPTELKLDPRQAKLYDLIWRRFMACQMSQAIFDTLGVDIKANNYNFRATGQKLKFDGFLKIYPLKYEEAELPEMKKNDQLKLLKLAADQHFTQPPARYNEATLIKALEENGVGRPSTYAPILSNIQDKNYIEKDDQKRFKPTEIGQVVNDLLNTHFPKIVDIGFTAKMENELDEVAQGEKDWLKVIKEFYSPFAKNLAEKYDQVDKKDITEKPTANSAPNAIPL
jgi:DNA topoisomerase-1